MNGDKEYACVCMHMQWFKIINYIIQIALLFFVYLIYYFQEENI